MTGGMLMKKFIKILTISLVAVTCIFTTSAYASSAVDKLYNEAYTATIKVDNIAKQYGVKPYWRDGSSPTDNVVNAVSKGNMQSEIMDARKKVDALPSSIQTMKNTLSSMLDDYQHPVFEKIVLTITSVKNQVSALKYKDASTWDDFTLINDTFKECQEEISKSRALIKDVPSYFQSSYSSTIDTYQQTLFNIAEETISKAEAKRQRYAVLVARNLVFYLEKPTYFSDDTKNYVNGLRARVDKIIINRDVVTKEKILEYILSKGYKETVNDDRRISYSSSDNLRDFQIYKTPSEYFFIGFSEGILNDKENLIKFIFPSGHLEIMEFLKQKPTENISYESDGYEINIKYYTNVNSYGVAFRNIRE